MSTVAKEPKPIYTRNCEGYVALPQNQGSLR